MKLLIVGIVIGWASMFVLLVWKFCVYMDEAFRPPKIEGNILDERRWK